MKLRHSSLMAALAATALILTGCSSNPVAPPQPTVVYQQQPPQTVVYEEQAPAANPVVYVQASPGQCPGRFVQTRQTVNPNGVTHVWGYCQ